VERREGRHGLGRPAAYRAEEESGLWGKERGRAGPAPVGPPGQGKRMGGFGACGWEGGQNRERGRGFCFFSFYFPFFIPKPFSKSF